MSVSAQGPHLLGRLLDAGVLKKGQKVLFNYKDKQFSADIDADGGLRSEDEHFKARISTRLHVCSHRTCAMNWRVRAADPLKLRYCDGPKS